jgi:hypothetical protein
MNVGKKPGYAEFLDAGVLYARHGGESPKPARV